MSKALRINHNTDIIINQGGFKMKRNVFLSLLVLAAVFLLIGCASDQSGGGGLIIPEDPSVVKDGSELAPYSKVRFAWLDDQGQPLLCDLTIERNGEVVEAHQNVKELETSFTEEGHYTARITSVNARSSRAIHFTVAELYSQLYNSDKGRYYIEDVSEDMKRGVEDADQQPRTFFVKMDERTVDNEHPEKTNVEVFLIPEDTNGDGIIDKWDETEDMKEALPVVGGLTETASGLAVFNRVLYTEDEIVVLDLEIVNGYNPYDNGQIFKPENPIPIANTGFKLNTEYARLTLNRENPNEEHFRNIMLAERYDSDEKPVFSLELEDDPEKENGLLAKIKAPDVAKFAELYKTQYMQLAVTFPSGLKLSAVEFPDFFDQSGEISSHQVIELPSAGQKVAMLFKGIAGSDNGTGQPSETFAVLHLEIEAESGSGKIGLIFENPMNDESSSIAASILGPLFKDVDNRNVDGFIIDYESGYSFSWANGGVQ